MKPDGRDILPCDTHALFFDADGRTDSMPSALVGADPDIDEEAVFSVLQFGAVVPPLSPWRGIHRCVPGYVYHGLKKAEPVELALPTHLSDLDVEEQADEVDKLLDATLKEHIGEQEDPVLLFSGGVDSGIIASRLAALGYRNSLLLNFSFGDADPESEVAEAMARRLGLKFKRVYGHRPPCSCLADPGVVYPQPFGDHSTVPTSDLARSVVEHLSGRKRLIIDGTGADGAFGMTANIRQWEQVSRIPALVRKAAATAYGKMLWHRKGRAEYFSRILRRSVEMPLLSAIVAQNPLAGVFYSKAAGPSVYRLLEAWVEGWAGDLPAARMVAADLALTCANIFAQKARPILESAGHAVLYPFLEADMVALALSSIPHWKMEEPKAPLKQSLARHVPRDMVYRPKSGFVDPRGEVFFCGEFIDYLRTAAEPTGPVSHLLEKKPVLEACDLLARKRALPAQTLNLLWAIVFTDRWYRTPHQ